MDPHCLVIRDIQTDWQFAGLLYQLETEINIVALDLSNPYWPDDRFEKFFKFLVDLDRIKKLSISMVLIEPIVCMYLSHFLATTTILEHLTCLTAGG